MQMKAIAVKCGRQNAFHTMIFNRYCRPVPLQVGQTIFLLPPQVLQVLPLTLPVPLQTGQRIVFAP